ncbi:MAG: carbohydrate kinase family protein [Anaerolineae bacterium]
MGSVIVLGDINGDLIAHFDFYPTKGQDALASSIELHCGGSAANTAAVLAQIGVEVSLIARIGPDPIGMKALDALQKAGVILNNLQRDATTITGLMVIVVTPDGERTILGYRGANVWTDPDQMQEEEFRRAQLLHLSGYALLADPQRTAALRALEMARHYGLTVTLDPGMVLPEATRNEVQALLPTIHILLLNLAEARQWTGPQKPEDCISSLLAMGVRSVALKLGREGCLIGHGGGLMRVPGFTILARDSTGAGDSFDAGILAGYLNGLDWHRTALLGNALGAMTTGRVGAGVSAKQAQQIVSLLQAEPPLTGPPGYVWAIQQILDTGSLTTETEGDK